MMALTEVMSIVGLAFSAAMGIGWLIFSKSQYLSFVDAVWALGIGAAALIFFSILPSHHWQAKVSLVLILVWSFRLGWYLIQRLRRHYPREDIRYERLKETWREHLRLKTFFFFQFQALVQIILFYPIAVILLNEESRLKVLEVFGAVFVIVGLVGEAVADDQLRAFKSIPLNSGNVCDQGLWRYSRHPNYFFEWIIWVGFALFALPSPGGLLSLGAPVLMLFLLLFVTGVKPSEEQSLKSKGDSYRAYQRQTSAFLILPRRRNGGDHGS